MGAGADMPPLLLDDDEAVAVFVGLQQIAGVGEAPVRALAKMEQILPARLARRVTALRAVVVTAGAADVAVDARTLTLLASACRDQESLRFRYSDYGGKVSTRCVEPYRLVVTRGLWYLVGWDVDRGDWRTFRVDRIGARPVAGERFAARPAPPGDLASFVTDGYWRSLEKCRARVRVMVPAEEATRRYSGGVFAAIDAESCYWEAAAVSWEKLAMHLGWMGADFFVEGPAELIEAIRRMEKQYRRALKSAR